MEIRFRKTITAKQQTREKTLFQLEKNNNVDTVIKPAVSQLIVAVIKVSSARPLPAPQRQVISSSGHRTRGLSLPRSPTRRSLLAAWLRGRVSGVSGAAARPVITKAVARVLQTTQQLILGGLIFFWWNTASVLNYVDNKLSSMELLYFNYRGYRSLVLPVF